jgi:hypothetical protein
VWSRGGSSHHNGSWRTSARGPGLQAQLSDPDCTPIGIPRAWTSLAAVDPFELISAGRACFRPADWVDLAALIDGLRGLAGRGDGE